MEFAHEVVVTNVFNLGFGGAGDYEATRGQLVAWMLLDVILLASDEGFVDFDGAGLHDAVIHYLVA